MSKLLNDLQGRFVGVDDNPEYEDIIFNADPKKLKECAICGKPFIKNRRAVYCGRQHYTICVNCGNRIDIGDIYFRAGFVPKTCCKTCADIVGVQTLKDNCLNKYGVTNPMYVKEFADKSFLRAHPDLDLSMRNAVETRNCEICGKEFTVSHTDPKKCCSVECASALRAQHVRENIKICKFCGKPFTSDFGKSLYCSGPHYQTCIICGKSFELKSLDHLSQTCSMECRDKLSRQTNMTKYGVEVGSQSQQAREKLSKAYYIGETARIQTCLDRYGVPNSSKSEVIRKKISNTVKSAKCQQQISDTCMKKYGVRHSSQSPEVHRRNWSHRKNIRGCDGLPLDSTWERTVYDFWKSLDLTVERNIPIKFDCKGKQHTTYIDFRVNGILYEVKSKPYIEGAYSDDETFIVAKLDVYRNYNVVLITDNQVMYLFEDGTFTGINLALFEDIPDFPYDAKSRWTIIEYLVKHTKGFIDFLDFQ